MEIGVKNNLKVNRFTENGAYLVDDNDIEVLLPNKYVPNQLEKKDTITVFVYTDSEDRLVATTLTPKVQRNEFACLQVRDVNKYGAFMDWGLEKDLFIPFKEQETKMRSGQWHIVYTYLDQLTKRMMATTKTHHYFEKENITLVEGEEVNIVIGNTTPNGTTVIVNNKYQGLLYENEIFEELLKGESKKAYVKKIREDKKIDVSLRKTGMKNLEEGAQTIINALERNNGQLLLHDKSSPEEIQMILHMSKKNFKRSLGILYKKRLVSIQDNSISLI